MAFPNNTRSELQLCRVLPFLTIHREPDIIKQKPSIRVIEIFGYWGFCNLARECSIRIT